MNLYVLTDGLWDRHSDPETPVRNLVNWMVQHHLGYHHFMIQFITFGAGDDITQRLQHLDSGLDLPL